MTFLILVFFSTGQYTNTGAALNLLRTSMFTSQNGDNPAARNVGIIFADSESVDRDVTFAEAVLAHEANIDLISFGINIGVSVINALFYVVTSRHFAS